MTKGLNWNSRYFKESEPPRQIFGTSFWIECCLVHVGQVILHGMIGTLLYLMKNSPQANRPREAFFYIYWESVTTYSVHTVTCFGKRNYKSDPGWKEICFLINVKPRYQSFQMLLISDRTRFENEPVQTFLLRSFKMFELIGYLAEQHSQISCSVYHIHRSVQVGTCHFVQRNFAYNTKNLRIQHFQLDLHVFGSYILAELCPHQPKNDSSTCRCKIQCW